MVICLKRESITTFAKMVIFYRRQSIHQRAGEAFQNDFFGLGHDPVDQFLARRDVIDQAGDHAAGPGAGIHLPVDHDLRIDACDFLNDILELERRAEFLFLLQETLDCRVCQHTFGIAQGAHHEAGVEFGGSDQRLLNVLVDRGFFRRDEARAHVHALGAERHGGDQ